MDKARSRVGVGSLGFFVIWLLDWAGRAAILESLGITVKPGGFAAQVVSVIDSLPPGDYAAGGVLLGLAWVFWPTAEHLLAARSAPKPKIAKTDLNKKSLETSLVFAPPSVIDRLRAAHPDRAILSDTVHDVMRECSGHTTHEMQQVGAKYIGKWMAFGFVFGDLRVDDGGRMVLVSAAPNTLVATGCYLSLFFDPTWMPKLETLRQGEMVNVFGVLKRIQSSSLVFNQCELLSTDALVP